MFPILKLIKKFLGLLNADAAPWQVWLGTALGLLFGLLPWWSWHHGPSPLATLVLLAALFLNCHLGAVFLFTGLGTLLHYALWPPADLLAPWLESVAAACAEAYVGHASLLSHTGYLALTLFAVCLAPLAGTAMAAAAHRFQTRYRDRLRERKRLMAAGKVAGNGLLLRASCWFFGV